ncbi:hypothetical protein BS47DRAFT_1390620 [Hydnum rufescens UP504]|uniref:Uncharacterized protein n=1 Tax=Hydnum rufescens UP504 TaxID=1448309 RepID=A0A9P6B328_9AGAM|nr:hypothetical protein BS47DRAFT_1390620 [Hydnum rufescens UP504]
MCLNGNNATHVSHYLNAQLTALWENSRECVHHYGDTVKLDDSHKYSTAFAQFSVGRAKGLSSEEEYSFFASFGQPRLQFLCNHDVVLHLRVERGYFDLQSLKGDSFIPLRERRIDFHEEIHVAFRVPFTTTGIRGRDHKIGSGEHFIRLVVLDLAKARLVSTDATGNTLNAVTIYLRQYLDLLVRAGHHIFFSLPEVDDARYRLAIDFSSISTDIKWDIEELHGISLGKINSFLSSSWLKSAWLANSREGLPADRSKICISEYKSTWSNYSESELHFHLKFNAPQVKALCGREAVVFFSVEEVFFSETKDFTSTSAKLHYTNWEIALIVDVIHEIREGGHIAVLKIDLSNARFSQYLSNFTGINEDDPLVVAYINRLIEFFSYEYLQILETAEFHIIYYHDTRITVNLEYETGFGGSWESSSRDEVIRGDTWWRDITTKTDMFEFDQIIAVSQESIDEHFRVLLRTYKNLETWSYSTFFNATFGGITVRLLSNERAIIWIDVKEGRFKTLRDWVPWPESNDHRISGWRLAFEVELKIANRLDLKDLTEEFRTRFEASFAGKFESKREHTVLRQIYLDVHQATFIHELSTFDDASYGRSRLGIDKVQAVIYYIQDHFLRHLSASGHHILYSIPVWVADKVPRDMPSPMSRSTYIPNKSLNEAIGVYSTNWLIRASEGISYGTVSLSRHLFLDGLLIPLLNKVNVATTVVPIHIGVEAGEWDLALSTWGGKGSRKKGPCPWKSVGASADALLYKWEHRDEWTYEHDSSVKDGNKGSYFVAFHTHNQLSIPTVFKRNQLDIILSGSTSVQIGYKGDHKESSAKASATWATHISFISTGTGLRIDAVYHTPPTFDKTHIQGEFSSIRHKDPRTLLKDVIPDKVEIVEVITSLKESFESVWQSFFPGLYAYTLANPVFTTRGDLLLELRPHGAWGLSASTSAGTNKSASLRSPPFGPNKRPHGRVPSYSLSPNSAHRQLPNLSRSINGRIDYMAVNDEPNGKGSEIPRSEVAPSPTSPGDVANEEESANKTWLPIG